MGLACEIKFDQNPMGVYFAGQILSGAVELNLSKIKKVKGVYLKIIGLSKSHWSERISTGTGNTKQTRTIVYEGREDYLSTTTYLIGADNESDGYVDLLPGIHTFNFSCVLPERLPSSFEGTHGHIRYSVIVVLNRPWKFDHIYKVTFTVLKKMDLNLETPIIKIPAQLESSKNFCCGPCSSGPLSITAVIPQSGFVPGQQIFIHAEVNNMSRVQVEEVKFILRKIIRYYSQTPMRKSREEIINVVERRKSGINKNDHGRYEQLLPVPPLPPTNINLCHIIHITYDLKIEAAVSGIYNNLSVSMPITIGTVALNIRNATGGSVTHTTFGVKDFVQSLSAPIVHQPMLSEEYRMMSFGSTSLNADIEITSQDGQSTSSMSRHNGVNYVRSTSKGIGNQSFNGYPENPPPTYEESLSTGTSAIRIPNNTSDCRDSNS